MHGETVKLIGFSCVVNGETSRFLYVSHTGRNFLHLLLIS